MNSIAAQLKQKISNKTKPLGSLGVLESLALKIGTIQASLKPVLKQPTIIVFAGDHGVAKAGVSAYPQEVTYQMVMNFLNGGAAINVFSKLHKINLKVVDAGVNFDFEPHSDLVAAKIDYGTANFTEAKAMTKSQLEACFNRSKEIVKETAESGCNVIGFGEMGIGNTSSASMLMSYLCGLPIEKCVGRGTGLNDEQLEHKTALLRKAQQVHRAIEDPKEVLQTFGGFEIAQMCGAMLAAHERNMLLLVDGFIATSAFLVAYKINPKIKTNTVFSHLSDEYGHKYVLDYLKATPIMHLNMRLGEGTGCAMVYPIIQSAVAFLNDMASFESASVTNN